MTSQKLNRGFTLIELLVVIAITGVLSSIVLTSTNSARTKGSNSTIKANLANARVQAELYFDTNDTAVGYNGLCTTGVSNPGGIKSIRAMVDAAHGASSAPVANISYLSAFSQVTNPTFSVCHATSAGWAASIPLKVQEGTSVYWCTDHVGTSVGRITALGANAIVCPAS